MSNSNEPSHTTGDIVIIDNKFPIENYNIGDSILYNNPVAGEIVIHRIYDIREFNETKFFAIKGDSNPQPDFVTGSTSVRNVILKNQSITWSSFYENSSDPTTDIVVSYFLGQDVILGKVIIKIPVLGWIFVPFNSPILFPFPFLTISVFNFFVLFFVIVTILSLFSLINKANNELKNFLASLTYSKVLRRKTIHFNSWNFYQFLLFPIIIFSFTVIFESPSQFVYNQEISYDNIEKIDENAYNLSYVKKSTFTGLGVKQNNESYISIIYQENENEIIINYKEFKEEFSESILPEFQFNISSVESYNLTLDKTNLFVETSSNLTYKDYNLFWGFKLPNSTITDNFTTGIMVNNQFLKSFNGVYENKDSLIGYRNISIIQDLIQIDESISASFDKNNGFLLNINIVQTAQWWPYPEAIGMGIIFISVVFLYEGIKRNVQRSFNLKQDLILESQTKMNDESLQPNEKSKPSDYRLEKYPEYKESSEFKETQNLVNDEVIKKKDIKKMSWEEYQKLEES